jgi:subtilisin family serine protease
MGRRGYSQALRDAIVRAAQANILFVRCCGNDGYNNDFNPSYPANFETASSVGYESIISVAALAKDGTMAWWSHYGARSVDLAAPGDNITSTLPNNKYKAFNGTSMATPHVAGAAALYAARFVGVSQPSASQIRAAILGSTIPTPTLAGKSVTGGRLNVSAF